LAREADSENPIREARHSSVLLTLLVAGLLVFFIGIVFLTLAASFFGYGNSTSFGVIIFLGPVPIVIGAGPQPILILLIAASVTVLTVLAFFLKRRRRKKGR
jgi:uncharacterized membrane protein